MFGIDPVVAMLSYSSGDSGQGADVDKVRRAWASRLEGQMAEVPSLERVVGETRRALRMHLAL